MQVGIQVNGQINYYDLDKYGKQRVYFGRSPECEIQINSSCVSSVHGFFENEDGRWYVFDNDSTNGLFVNDIKTGRFEFSQPFEIISWSNQNDRILIIPQVAGRPEVSDQVIGSEIETRNSKLHINMGTKETEPALQNTSQTSEYQYQHSEASQKYTYSHSSINGSSISASLQVVKNNIIQNNNRKIFGVITIIAGFLIILGCFLPYFVYDAKNYKPNREYDEEGIFDEIVEDYNEELVENYTPQKEALINGKDNEFGIFIIVFALIIIVFSVKTNEYGMNLCSAIGSILSLLEMGLLDYIKNDLKQEGSYESRYLFHLAKYSSGFYLILIAAIIALVVNIIAFIINYTEHKRKIQGFSFCRKCGAQISSVSAFCSSCGMSTTNSNYSVLRNQSNQINNQPYFQNSYSGFFMTKSKCCIILSVLVIFYILMFALPWTSFDLDEFRNQVRQNIGDHYMMSDIFMSSNEDIEGNTVEDFFDRVTIEEYNLWLDELNRWNLITSDKLNQIPSETKLGVIPFRLVSENEGVVVFLVIVIFLTVTSLLFASLYKNSNGVLFITSSLFSVFAVILFVICNRCGSYVVESGSFSEGSYRVYSFPGLNGSTAYMVFEPCLDITPVGIIAIILGLLILATSVFYVIHTKSRYKNIQ